MAIREIDILIPQVSQCTRCLAIIPAMYYTDGTYDSEECPNGCDDR